MIVYLGFDCNEQTGYDLRCDNIATLNKEVLDNQATEITCVNFLSSVDYSDVENVLRFLCGKLRMGGSLTVVDIDAEMMAGVINSFGKDSLADLDISNMKSLITMEEVKGMVPQGLKLSAMAIHERVKFTITVKRRG